MAVDIPALDLAVALRASDGSEPLTAPLDGIMDRLLAATTSLVETYAVDAPVAVQNEAVVRCAAWLYDSVPGRQAANALDLSGARSLLGPYRARRVHVVGDA